MATQSFKNCQSCGMPLARDEQGGGNNSDGSKNEMYCSHCFQAGKFTMPERLCNKCRNARVHT